MAPILHQLAGQWHKLTAMLLSKFAKPGEEVVLTEDDLKRLALTWPKGAIVFVHGRVDSLALKLVSPEEAERIKAFEAMSHVKTKQ